MFHAKYSNGHDFRVSPHLEELPRLVPMSATLELGDSAEENEVITDGPGVQFSSCAEGQQWLMWQTNPI